MRSIVLLFLVLTAAPGRGAAQSQAFDPAVFLSTVNIHQYYGHGNVRVPDGMRAMLVDSLFTDRTCVAFSMRLVPDSGAGWTLWLDFDADRYYRPRLTRVFAQRPVDPGDGEAFTRFRDWVAKVQRRNIGDIAVDSEDHAAWPWQRRTGYRLEIRRVTQEGDPWLTLSLAPHHADPEDTPAEVPAETP